MNTAIVYLRKCQWHQRHVVAVTVSIADPNTAYTEACRLAMLTIPPADRVLWSVDLGETMLVDQTVLQIQS